jgi:hypothetical protein
LAEGLKPSAIFCLATPRAFSARCQIILYDNKAIFSVWKGSYQVKEMKLSETQILAQIVVR